MSDANFLREIDEELRRDRLMKLWERYGVYAVAAAILLIAAIGGWRAWQWHEARESAKAGAQFEQAVTLSDAGKQVEAEKEFAAIAKDAPSGYRMLARLQLAGDAGAKNAAEGVKAFDEIATDSSIDPVLRELAKVRAVFLLVDTAPVSEIAARVEPLTAKSAPFHNSAKEALALSYYRAGDRAKARALYAEILADPEVSPSLANRAQVMQTLTAEGSAAAQPVSPTQ
jgi:hypothetical protein